MSGTVYPLVTLECLTTDEKCWITAIQWSHRMKYVAGTHSRTNRASLSSVEIRTRRAGIAAGGNGRRIHWDTDVESGILVQKRFMI